MSDQEKNTQIPENDATQVFTPDFGSTFDDYGEYSEPVTEAPVRASKRARHVKRIRFPRLIWIAVYVAVAVGLGLLGAALLIRLRFVGKIALPEEVVILLFHLFYFFY